MSAHVLTEVVRNGFHENLEASPSFAVKFIRDLLVFQKRRARSYQYYGQCVGSSYKLLHEKQLLLPGQAGNSVVLGASSCWGFLVTL